MVRLADIVPFAEEHLWDAYMDEMPDGENYAWLLDGLMFIEPFEVKGKLHLYDVDDALIKPRNVGEPCAAFAERCYKPLMKWEDKYATRAEIEGMWEDWMGFLRRFEE